MNTDAQTALRTHDVTHGGPSERSLDRRRLHVIGDDSTAHSRTPLPRDVRALYLTVLTWSFTFFSSVRILAYLPTVLAIVHSGDSSQHSLLTWITWAGANTTMAAWLYEQNGARSNRAVVVNICNALMCTITLLTILYFRLPVRS